MGIGVLGRPGHTFGAVIGPGSTWGLDGQAFVERRRLLAPPLHGKRISAYERTIDEEVRREIADWPQGREFATLAPMRRITLRSLLRTVFGAEGAALDRLCRLVPPAVGIGSRIGLMPPAVRRDAGRWSPGGRFAWYRRQIDAVIESLIADARHGPGSERRDDVLALLLRARDDNGEPMPDRHISDELLTLLMAGHESTSTTLAWAVERIRRHPRLLSRLIAEADAGGSELRRATILEVQRSRPVVDATLRRSRKRIRLGDWVIPEDTTLLISLQLANELSFVGATDFNPDRFLAGAPQVTWFPFGGGVNRCIGSAFATMEMDVTLRRLLREFHFVPTDAPGERPHDRGVAIAPRQGGKAVVYRRRR